MGRTEHHAVAETRAPAPHEGYFTRPLSETDPGLAAMIGRELARQRDQIELIASENLVSRAVLDAQGSVMTNKTVEGYPGARFHGGADFADEIERLAIERATRLFGCRSKCRRRFPSTVAELPKTHPGTAALSRPAQRNRSQPIRTMRSDCRPCGSSTAGKTTTFWSATSC